MVEIHSLRIMARADIDDGHFRVGQLFLRRILTEDRGTISRDQNTNGEKVIFMGTPGMGHDRV